MSHALHCDHRVRDTDRMRTKREQDRRRRSRGERDERQSQTERGNDDRLSEASGREREGMTSQHIGEVMSDTETEQVEQTCFR